MAPWSRFLGATLLALLLLTACGDRPELQPLPSDATILAFGDSLTAGTGGDAEHNYPALLEKRLGHRVINAGVPGELSAEGVKRLPSLLERHDPDLVILCHGGNDLLKKRDRAQLAAHLRTMIRASRDHGAQVLLVGVPEPGVWLRDAKLYRQVAEETGTVYEGDALEGILGDGGLKSDPVHPNGEGYRKLAGAIAERLEEAGVVESSSSRKAGKAEKPNTEIR